jgi:hypothetical protein
VRLAQHESIRLGDLSFQFQHLRRRQRVIGVRFQQFSQPRRISFTALAAGDAPQSGVVEAVEGGQVRLKLSGRL